MGDFRKNVRSRNIVKRILEKNRKIQALMLFVLIASIFLITSGTTLFIKIKHREEEISRLQEKYKEVEIEVFAATESELIVEENTEEVVKPKTDTTISITAIGDIIPDSLIQKDAKNKETNEFNYGKFFEGIQEHTKNSDLTIANLETTVSDNPYAAYPKYNVHTEFLTNLKDIGIDIVSASTNHIYDYKEEGVISTIDYLKQAEIDVIGINKTKEESENILIKDVKGIKIAFLNYGYGLNNNVKLPEDKSYLINFYDKDKIIKDIAKAKEQKAEIIIASMHWGEAGNAKPTTMQKDTTNFLIENGVDVILGSHPGIVQPMEVREIKVGDKDKNVFVAYSLGNFLAMPTYQYSNIQMFLHLQITKRGKDDSVYISKVTYTPVYFQDKGKKETDRYNLVDMKKAIEEYDAGNTDIVSRDNYYNIRKAIEDLEKLIGKTE